MLESKNPKTGKLYTLSDLNVLKMQNVGTGMLEDGIFSTESWLKDPANQATAVKFIKASLEGWIYCRDHEAACVKYTLQAGPTLPVGHQTWQISGLQQADPGRTRPGIGIMNKAAYTQTPPRSPKQFGVDQEHAVGHPTAPTWRRRRSRR